MQRTLLREVEHVESVNIPTLGISSGGTLTFRANPERRLIVGQPETNWEHHRHGSLGMHILEYLGLLVGIGDQANECYICLKVFWVATYLSVEHL